MLHLELLYLGPRRNCKVNNRRTWTKVQRGCELARFHSTDCIAAFETSVESHCGVQSSEIKMNASSRMHNASLQLAEICKLSGTEWGGAGFTSFDSDVVK